MASRLLQRHWPVISRTHLRLKSTRARAKWFYNTDVPISKPEWYEYEPDKEPQKFVPFSDYDNFRLEMAYKNKRAAVEVKEDRLFEVVLDEMALKTIYWDGPVYEVRRGTWFTTDGSPLSEKLTAKIEQGYEEIRAYDLKENSGEKSDVLKDLTDKFNKQVETFNKQVETAKAQEPDRFDVDKENDVVDLGNGRAVIYFDKTYGALFPTSLSTLQVSMIRSLQPTYGSLMSVVPIRRGYTSDLDSSLIESLQSKKTRSLSEIFLSEVATLFTQNAEPEKPKDAKSSSELLAQVLESDAKNDYSDKSPERQIDHLVLCVHGIGQLLGYQYELVNFSHSVNVMRSTMREVYSNEKKYQELAHGSGYNAKSESQKVNNKIQVLPVTWRDRVSFHPRRSPGLEDQSEEPRLPSLSQINVDGVKPLRNVVGDVILDVLLYYEPLYLKQIMKAVVSELNDLYRKYCQRNPQFKGKVHLFGHSLGLAICFDLLSQQKESDEATRLDFDVENFFCVGSPVGMFELLRQRNILPRDECSEDEISLDANFSSPKCKNIYNIFHPCDPVSYRMEPLVEPRFAALKAEEVPFALQGFNTQVQNLTSISDGLQEKLMLASSWFKKSPPKSLNTQIGDVLSSEIQKENALGDIISTLTSSKNQKSSSQKTKTETYSAQDLGNLLKLNRTGRVDYALPMGVFSIPLVSAISAHISYFEDEETIGFVMKEILTCGEPPVESRKVTVYN